VGGSVSQSFGWSGSGSVGRQFGWLAGGFLGRWVGCSFGGLVGWSTEWLVDLGGCLDDLKTRETFSLAEIDR
jgi:hypothetical protein